MENNHIENLVTLFKAISLIESEKEAENFLTDLCTPQEIKSFIERWKVCQLLAKGDLAYREIKDLTGASLATIGRVARFLNSEPYKGYKKLLDKIKQKEKNDENSFDSDGPRAYYI